MKRLILILLALMLNTLVFSCTPETLTEDNTQTFEFEYDCCGGGDGIPPKSDNR